MKKTFIFGLLAAALGFTACSSEDDGILAEKTLPQQGMVLKAIVEHPTETRATIDNTEKTWQFAFDAGDKVIVRNSELTKNQYYTFTSNGTDFVCAAAKTTASPVSWYATYPSDTVVFAGQDGTLAGLANKFQMIGKSEPVTGADGLTIKMQPQVAVLVIDNQKGDIEISVMQGEKYFFAVHAANELPYSTLSEKKSFLTAKEAGTYYLAVPAGQQLTIKDGDKVIKSTKEAGLTAGCYYNLTIEGGMKAKFDPSDASIKVKQGSDNVWNDTPLAWSLPATRAALTPDGEDLKFAYSVGDKVTVKNSENKSYEFTFEEGDKGFVCKDAKPTEKAAKWTAYFPSAEVSLLNQSGTLEDLAKYYLLIGSQDGITGADGLDIKMEAQCAVLVINNQKGNIDINVKRSAEEWVDAIITDPYLGVGISSLIKKVSLLTATEKGTYYVVVPAGKQIAIKDGDTVIKSTTTAGLKAGYYYNLTIEGGMKAKFEPSDASIKVKQGNDNVWNATPLAWSLPATRAALTPDGEDLKFAYSVGDKVTVKNSENKSYEFTFEEGDKGFVCKDAKPTEKAAKWTAYFPSAEVSLANQSGTLEDLAKYYLLIGSQDGITGADGLDIKMEAQCAVLVIDNQKGNIDINVKRSAEEWVDAIITDPYFGVGISSLIKKVSLLTATEKGTYYVVVPAGKQIAIKDGDTVIKSTTTAGLKAGFYYNITVEAE